MSLSRRQLAVIHIAKKALGLSDEYYRQLLWEVGRVRTSKELDYQGFRMLMRRFEALGWKDGEVREYREVKGQRMASTGQVKKIWKLWFLWVGDGERTARRQLRRFLEKRWGVSDVRWLSHRQAYEVIEALKEMLGRRDGKQQVE